MEGCALEEGSQRLPVISYKGQITREEVSSK